VETRLAVEGLAISPNMPHSNVRSDPVYGNTIEITSRGGSLYELVSLLVPYIRQQSLDVAFRFARQWQQR
jgi:hypothetical protein